MKNSLRTRLSFETLENRCVPAITMFGAKAFADVTVELSYNSKNYGDAPTLDAKITNKGLAPAKDVVLGLNLTSSQSVDFDLRASTSGIKVSGSNVTYRLPSLKAGAEKHVKIQLASTMQTQMIDGYASVRTSSPEKRRENNEINFNVYVMRITDVTLKVSGPTVIDQGSKQVFTVTAGNVGSFDATDGRFYVYLPPDRYMNDKAWRVLEGDYFYANIYYQEFGTLRTGENVSSTFELSTDQLGEFSFWVHANSQGMPDSDYSNGEARIHVEITPRAKPPVADLSVEWLDGEFFESYGSDRLFAVATNKGTVATKGYVTIVLPPELDWNSGVAGRTVSYSYDVEQVVWDLGSFEPRQSKVFGIGVAPGFTGSKLFTVTVSSDSPDTNLDNNRDAVEVTDAFFDRLSDEEALLRWRRLLNS